ncbi:MAG: hypothetical protein J2P20_18340, partial [Pseudonocardia sp.]|nr:hypothetical protein [Pseudonocardia sp.]
MTDVMAPDRYARLQPRNWPLPVKLASVLLVPTLLGLVLGGLRIADRTHDANSLAALDRYVTLRDKASAVITQLQKERDLASVFVQNNRIGDQAVVRDAD